MLPRTVRGVVEVAAGLAEEVGKRVVGTAAVILERTGVDVTEVERRLGGQFPPSAKTLQTLAEEAVTAGRAGVDLAVGVARGEVEKAFEKVGDQVMKVGVVLAYLESKLREVEEEAEPAARSAGADEAAEPAPAPRADDLFGRGWERADEQSAAPAAGEPIVAERVEVDEPVEVDPPVPPVRPSVPGKAAAKRTPAKKPTATEPAPAEKAQTEKAPAAGRTGAKKSPAKKAAAEKPVAKKTAAKKTTVRKTAVKKTATGQQAAAEPPAQPKAPAKRTATKKTTVRKATSTKKPDDRTS
ncbi:histone H1-like repetitive region-containing protein [Kitasatospora sp. NBC_01300]|uniref:histone H1-like repetitive region-containing protein n=1 Tax=Kitasatospora sp. NBC_01300 TaxID=2903574 RepID=UPI00352D6F98|nr:histone H1-like repetitive region-containing protein [Kitasatospora sp. NBC_01300]